MVRGGGQVYGKKNCKNANAQKTNGHFSVRRTGKRGCREENSLLRLKVYLRASLLSSWLKK